MAATALQLVRLSSSSLVLSRCSRCDFQKSESEDAAPVAHWHPAHHVMLLSPPRETNTLQVVWRAREPRRSTAEHGTHDATATANKSRDYITLLARVSNENSALDMDDLLDLDWGKSQGNAAASAKTGAATPSSGSGYRSPPSATKPGYPSSSALASSYNFDALTRSMPSASRSGRGTPIGAATTSAAPAASASSAAAGDAFSSLFSFGGGGSGGASTPSTSAMNGMTMAQRRQHQVQQDKGGNATGAPNASSSSDGWAASSDGWDAFEKQGNSASKPSPQPAVTKAKKQTDPFDFSRGDAKTAPTPARAPPARNDPFDFSDFEDPGDSQSSALGGAPDESKPRPSSQRTVDFFDDDSREDLGSRGPTRSNDDINDEDEDDFLGALGRPVEQRAREKPPSSPARKPRPAGRSTTKRAASPPPHLLGRIVEMGFSPIEAREALAKTETGLDVEAALEMLLHSGGGGGASSRQQEQRDREYAESLQQHGGDPEMEEYEEKERQRARARRGQSTTAARSEASGGLAVPRGARPDGRRSPRGDGDTAAAAAEQDFDWQKQADALYSQASEFSANMFTKANAFWSTAKTQAQKALEERNASAPGSSGANTPNPETSGRSSPAVGADAVAAARAWARRWGTKGPPAGSGPAAQARPDGRPRWMVEAEEREQQEESSPSTATTTERPADAFRDSDNEDEPAPPFLPNTAKNAEAQDAVLPPRPSRAAAPPTASAARAVPTGPASHAGPAPRSAPRRAPAAAAAAAPPPSKPKVSRQIIPDDLQPAGASAKHKEVGNAAFKKGAYGEAEAAYTAALQTLPETSLRRIPLLNNRANARLKNGDASAASRDCSAVLTLIVGDGNIATVYTASSENPLPASVAAEVNLRDGYGKALVRRAQAYEMLERWLPAMKDWQLLERYEKQEGSGATSGFRNMKSAQEGIKRCRGMVSGSGSGGKGDSATSAAPSSSSSSREVRSRKAAATAAASAAARAEEAGRQRVRAANAAQQAEESAAHSLKDSIDAKISAWKAGKETNIRALLASLENVIWPELNWKKVGMHEVITDAQVKKHYTRAMVKLHPDKVSREMREIAALWICNDSDHRH